MQCVHCEHLWELYEHHRKIHMNLATGAKWGAGHLKQALKRARDERQRARLDYLQHAATHTKQEPCGDPMKAQ